MEIKDSLPWSGLGGDQFADFLDQTREIDRFMPGLCRRDESTNLFDDLAGALGVEDNSVEKVERPFYPFRRDTRTTIAPLREDEMRITFMGSAIPPRTLAQRMMSIFVEVGWDPIRQVPRDQFVFDCGSGVCANYGAMNVGFGRMNKVFLTHLHGDHMSDLTHICIRKAHSGRLGVAMRTHSGWRRSRR